MGKELIWIGASKRNIIDFPDEVKDEIGFALHLAQLGQKAEIAKPFKISGETGVFEIVSNFNTDTYRAVYAVKIDERIYVLHTFKKKSNSGIKTPKHEVDLIKNRLMQAKELSKTLKEC